MTDLAWVVQLVIGIVLSILGYLLKKALEDVGKRLAEIAADVKEVREDVGEHATKLATLEAKVSSLTERTAEMAAAITKINDHGCARGCRQEN